MSPFGTSRRLAGALAVLLAAALQVGCGGSGGPEIVTEAVRTKARALSASAAADTQPLELPGYLSPQIVGLTKVAERRVSRTVFDYDFVVQLKNGPRALSNLEAVVAGAGNRSTVLVAAAEVGEVAAGATVTSSGKVTIRHDRSLPFAPSQLTWKFRASLQATGNSIDLKVDDVTAVGALATSLRADLKAAGLAADAIAASIVEKLRIDPRVRQVWSERYGAVFWTTVDGLMGFLAADVPNLVLGGSANIVPSVRHFDPYAWHPESPEMSFGEVYAEIKKSIDGQDWLGWSYRYTQQPASLTLNDFKRFERGLNIISVHGGSSTDPNPFGNDGSPYIWTGIVRKEKVADIEGLEESDILTKRVMFQGDKGHIALRPEYFDHHLGQLDPGVVIIFAACQSFTNSKFADVFLKKGAAAFIGFTDYVLVSYAADFVGALLEALGRGRTINDAFSDAKIAAGANDGEWLSKHEITANSALNEVILWIKRNAPYGYQTSEARIKYSSDDRLSCPNGMLWKLSRCVAAGQIEYTPRDVSSGSISSWSFRLGVSADSVFAVLWEFAGDLVRNSAMIMDGVLSKAVDYVFRSTGLQTVVAYFRDSFGTLIGQASAVVDVVAGPVVTSFIPVGPVVAGMPATFLLRGTKLPAGLVITIQDCGVAAELAQGGTDTQRQFTCTFPASAQAGSKDVGIGAVGSLGTPFERSLTASTISIELVRSNVSAVTAAPSPSPGGTSLVSVSGANLPATAFVLVVDATCDRSSVSARSDGSGFTQTCTFGPTTGTKGVTVLSSGDASGFIIDDNKSLTVSARQQPTTSLFDEFSGTAIDATVWNIDGWEGTGNDYTGGLGRGIGPVTINNGLVDFGRLGRISTKGKVVFSGDATIVIEGRMAGTGASHDSMVMLVDTASGDQILMGETNYAEWGFYALGIGSYKLKEVTNNDPTNPLWAGGATTAFMEYRLTIIGDRIKIERGPTLANITQSRAGTLGRSIVGRSFHISIGAAWAYFPATWDWIRVSNASARFTERPDTGSGWNLNLTVTAKDANGLNGTFDFGRGTCTGTLTYKGKDPGGNHVFNENHLTGACHKTCDVAIGPDASYYNERCTGTGSNGVVYNGTDIAPVNRKWLDPRPSSAQLDFILAPEPQSGDLFAKWTFDENCSAADSSGNFRSVLVNGSPSCGVGKYGKAIRFSGLEKNLDYQAEWQWLDLPRTPSRELTFATWFKWEPTTGLRSSGGTEAIWAIGDTESDVASTAIWISPGPRTLYAYGASSPGATVVPGEWTHVAITLDGNLTKFYVNGSFVHEVAHPKINLAFQPQYIAAFPRSGLHQPFAGLIDDARLYSRVLAPEEIRNVYLGN